LSAPHGFPDLRRRVDPVAAGLGQLAQTAGLAIEVLAGSQETRP
jgi:hypothetical protein